MVILLFVVHPIAAKIGKQQRRERRGMGEVAEFLSSRERFEAALLAACLLLEEICTLSPFPLLQMRFIFPVIVGKVLLAFLIAVCVCVCVFIHSLKFHLGNQENAAVIFSSHLFWAPPSPCSPSPESTSLSSCAAT